MMENKESRNGQAGSKTGRKSTEKAAHADETAQQMFSETRGALDDLGRSLDLKGRLERNPYGTLLAAVGVGYVLGGGLFTSLTASMVRVGVKLAAIPLVKDELVGYAEQTLDGFSRGGRTDSTTHMS